MPRHPKLRRALKSALVIACAFALAATAIVAISRLQDQSTAARDAQLKLIGLRLDLAQIQQVPWGAAPGEGDSLSDVRDELQGDQQGIEQTLNELSRGGSLPDRSRIDEPFRKTMAALWQILHAVSTGRSEVANRASDTAARQAYVADVALQKAAKHDRVRSLHALWKSRVGSAGVILLLVFAFAWFYRRAVRSRRVAEDLAAENRRLLAESQEEALTDPLTGLGNRRALMADFDEWEVGASGEQTLVALFDLDGFKHYNDSFGHPAGDAVLRLLGGRLADAVEARGRAYRMGGDEFCVLASLSEDDARQLAGDAAEALSETGVGFSITCSYGMALMPRETLNPKRALSLADQRMYRHKHSAAA
ncbi:MAG TPA: GGDEF domain-containing protein [Thermoleophilaceae bacterium]